MIRRIKSKTGLIVRLNTTSIKRLFDGRLLRQILEVLQIPEVYVDLQTMKRIQLINGEFYFENVVIVFSTSQNSRLLNDTDLGYGSTTFKFCSDLFYQMYTIHGRVGS